MLQPEKYINKAHLIQWLKEDLADQKSKGVAEEKLILNIGKKTNKQNKTNAIEFSLGYDFNLKGILSDLGDVLDDDIHNGNRICRYIVNLNKINSSKTGPIIDFSNTTFNNEIYASSSIFNLDVNFSNSIFIKEVNFNACNFMGVTYFKDSHFYKDAYFTSTFFNKMASFVGIKTRSKVTFDNLSFGKGTCIMFFRDIYCNEDECFTNSEIEIKNSVIDCRIDFNNVHISKFRFENASVINGGVISRVNFEPYIENSDTAIIFKHEELARSNTIKALKYKADEKKLYEDYLKSRIEKLKNNDKKKEDNDNQKVENIKTDNESKIDSIKEYKNKKEDKNIVELYAELLSLMLSRLSNNHGQDWIKAVRFIFITSFISVSLAYTSLISMKIFFVIFVIYLWIPFYICLDRKNYIKKSVPPVLISLISFYFIYTYFNSNISLEIILITYFSYLTPTNLDLMKVVAGTLPNSNLDINSLNPFQLISFYFFYIFGKIAIGYGIFQVIQAFRKFNIK